jgi:FtsP/CotA-like multicopper oxidase with cupredoxin domain/nitrite reductase/ring-hydroxylating ferredoxin subunit
MRTVPNHIKRLIREIVAPTPVRDPFDRDTHGLSPATATPIVVLEDGATYNLRAAAVAKEIGEQNVKLLAYNGSIPGPTLQVAQGAEITLHFSNQTEVETTAHWHGLRLDYHFDGVSEGKHGGMQPPIPPGGSFTYQLRFPDPGVYWYHPHIREDYTQEHGLYGNILVIPTDPDYWTPVNREMMLVADDILFEGGKVAPFSRSVPTHTVMGRFGNVMLVNGESGCDFSVRQGEVVRFYVTNTANARVFNLFMPGAKMKLVGGDSGRVEQEEFVENILLSPSERIIVEALFEQAGVLPIEHHTPEKTYQLATITVAAQQAEPSFGAAFSNLRRSQELVELRKEIAADFEREADKTIVLLGEMVGGESMPPMSHSGMSHSEMSHSGAHSHSAGIEWEDSGALHDSMAESAMMTWKIVDRATGKANHEIDWLFEAGTRVKIRIENPTDSDHPMQHPIHFHGQRFLVLGSDGGRNANLVWKDTVLVKAGETVDILLEASNPGTWMAHCHIAEHVEVGMMFNFVVREGGSEEKVARHVEHTTTLGENEFRIGDVAAGKMIVVQAHGEDVVVYNVAGSYYATQGVCTHAGGPLHKGELEGECIVCPWHGSRFNVRDGSVLNGPARRPLKSYQVIVEGEIGRVK